MFCIHVAIDAMPASGFCRSDCLVQIVDTSFLYLMTNNAEPDQGTQDQHCLQGEGMSWLSRTRVKSLYRLKRKQETTALLM